MLISIFLLNKSRINYLKLEKSKKNLNYYFFRTKKIEKLIYLKRRKM
jgi:hypothetical protein